MVIRGAFCIWVLLCPTASHGHDVEQALDDGDLLVRQARAVYGSSLPDERKASLFGVALKGGLWHKADVRVCFGPPERMTDSAFVEGVIAVAAEWDKILPIGLDFGKPGARTVCDGVDQKADIRVDLSFSDTGVFDSQIGTASTPLAPWMRKRYSMSLRFPKDRTSAAWQETARRFYVLHEFGHALGMLHEHQARTCGFADSFLKDMAARFGEANVDQMFSYMESYSHSVYPVGPGVYENTDFVITDPDRTSVMQYRFAKPEYFAKGKASPCFRDHYVGEISPLDKLVAVAAYNTRREALHLSARALSRLPEGTPGLGEAREVLERRSRALMAASPAPSPGWKGGSLLSTKFVTMSAGELDLLGAVLVMR